MFRCKGDRVAVLPVFALFELASFHEGLSRLRMCSTAMKLANPMFACSTVARSVASNVQVQWSESSPVYKTGKFLFEKIIISWVNIHTQDIYTLLQTNMAVYRCLLRSISHVALMLMALFIFGCRDRKRAQHTTRRHADSDPAVSPSGSLHCKNTSKRHHAIKWHHEIKWHHATSWQRYEH